MTWKHSTGIHFAPSIPLAWSLCTAVLIPRSPKIHLEYPGCQIPSSPGAPVRNHAQLIKIVFLTTPLNLWWYKLLMEVWLSMCTTTSASYIQIVNSVYVYGSFKHVWIVCYSTYCKSFYCSQYFCMKRLLLQLYQLYIHIHTCMAPGSSEQTVHPSSGSHGGGSAKHDLRRSLQQIRI